MANPSGETTLRRRRTAQRPADANNRSTENQDSNGTQQAENTANNNAGANNNNNNNDNDNNNNNGRGWLPQGALGQFLVRSVCMYLLMQQFKKPKTQQAGNFQQNATTTAGMNVTQSSPLLSNSSAVKGVNDWLSKMGVVQGPQPAYYSKSISCRWLEHAAFDVRVILSNDVDIDFRKAVSLPPSQTLWALSSLAYSTNERNYHSKNVTIDVPTIVSHENSTWYAHVFVVKGGLWNVASVGAVSDSAIEEHVLHARHDLVTWIEVNLKKKGKHLLGTDDSENTADSSSSPTSSSAASSSEENEDESAGDENQQCQTKNDDGTCGATVNAEETADANATMRYDQVWKPTLPIVLVIGTGNIMLAQLPPPAAERFIVSEKKMKYHPPMHVEEFWHLRDSMQPMNDTVKEIGIELSFKPISIYKWSMYRQFENMWDKQLQLGTIGKSEVDEMKRMFVETNPVLLGTTMVVSIAHSVLEGLAFKNDIAHWRNIKTMEGVSVRSMVWKIVMELIIFLYLWDHDTSWMIVVGNGVGLVIEIWKFCKAVKFEKFGEARLFGVIPWFKISDHESYSKKTKEYDEQAMKYMGYIIYPLVIGYALYSLKFDTHKSWYSWVVNSLVGAVYAFGFIMMFPQIFINYKLKSVAHIPMKAMMYKTLNTIIDDLFSFIIKMPWLHRLACFRDDIVFAILLYQRYLYPTDYTRVNEFGQQFDEKSELTSAANESSTGGTAAPTAAADSYVGQDDESSSVSPVLENSTRHVSEEESANNVAEPDSMGKDEQEEEEDVTPAEDDKREGDNR